MHVPGVGGMCSRPGCSGILPETSSQPFFRTIPRCTAAPRHLRPGLQRTGPRHPPALWYTSIPSFESKSQILHIFNGRPGVSLDVREEPKLPLPLPRTASRLGSDSRTPHPRVGVSRTCIPGGSLRGSPEIRSLLIEIVSLGDPLNAAGFSPKSSWWKLLGGGEMCLASPLRLLSSSTGPG